MTIDEALEQINAAGPCFVVFDADSGEVLEVHKQGEQRHAALLGTMTSASSLHGAVKGRFFDGATVTRATLEDEANESRVSARRAAIFSRWATMPPDELVQVLETDDFAPPMDTFYGPKFLIERIFEYAPAVLEPVVPRLERLAHEKRDELEESVHRNLESRLAVLAGDFARLKAVWERFDPNTFSELVWHPELLEYIGDLRPRDTEPIEILIQTVSTPMSMMFGPRCEALRSLGKVGAPAGPRAARGIRDAIHDSTPEIVALRERVLLRIETSPDAWAQCPQCYWGKVPGRPWQAERYCTECFGLGFVRVGLRTSLA